MRANSGLESMFRMHGYRGKRKAVSLVDTAERRAYVIGKETTL